jgi:uncharacterized beta-barrel protein YwiB (DUF1934 family)
MQPNVLLTIEGQQWNDDDEPQAIRLMTEGRLYRKDPAWYIVYDESTATGLEGTQTTLQVTDDGSVSLSRTGTHGMRLTFMAGNRHITRMETPYGDLDVEVYTSLVQTKVSEKGGYIHLGYSIDLNNRERTNTRLNVKIKQLPM